MPFRKQIDEVLATIALNHYFSARDMLIPKKHFYEEYDLPQNIKTEVEKIKNENPIFWCAIEPYLDRIDDDTLIGLISTFMEMGSGETPPKIVGRRHLDEYISARKRPEVRETNRDDLPNLPVKEVCGMKNEQENVVKIKIVGVGGGGNNIIERMRKTNIPMVSYVSINTDNGAYHASTADIKLQIGYKETKGLGAGANPEIGYRAAEESRKEIENALKDCDLILVTAGMGGGTGTGAVPIIADIAHKLGILSIGVVTTPFFFEGRKRMNNALQGIAQIENVVDSLLVIPNDNLKKVSTSKVTLRNAFSVADEVLVQTAMNLVSLIQKTAHINCDFADICSIVKNSGYMHTVTGSASGEDRVNKIIEQLLTNPLLNTSVQDSTGVLLCITASKDVELDEIDQISMAITNAVDPDANVIFGMDFDESCGDEIRAILIATKSSEINN